MTRKYKKTLKNCEDCKRLCFIVKGKIKEYYCSIFGNYYISKCDKKRVRR